MKLPNRFGVKFQQGVLKNGSRVYLFERAGMPIHVRAVFLAGSRFDYVPGTAHFLEHMLLAGTEKFTSKNLIADYIQRVGGDFGGNTESTLMRFMIEVPERDDLSIGIDVMSELLLNSLFNEKVIENERGAIISELRAKRSNPKEHIWDLTKQITAQGTKVGTSTLGDFETVNSISKQHLLDFYKDNICSKRATFIVSGDVGMETLINQLERIRLRDGSSFDFDKKLPVIREKKVAVEHYPGLTQLQVCISNRTQVSSFQEYCALRVLNQILAGGRGSRLIKKLRYDNGLVYSVSGSLYESVDWGMFRIAYSCDRSCLEKAQTAIRDEFELIKKDGITLEELSNAKSRVAKGIIRQLQTSESWVNFHEGILVFYPGQIKTVDDYIASIDQLNEKDMSDIANKYLNIDDFFLAICGDYENK